MTDPALNIYQWHLETHGSQGNIEYLCQNMRRGSLNWGNAAAFASICVKFRCTRESMEFHVEPHYVRSHTVYLPMAFANTHSVYDIE